MTDPAAPPHVVIVGGGLGGLFAARHLPRHPAVHIAFLIGFRNRLVALAQWAWAFLIWPGGARLVTEPWRSLP